MSEPSTSPVRITFSRGTKAAFGAFVVLQFGILGAQLALQEDQRTTVDRQLKTAVRQSREALPLIQETRPLVAQAHDALPAVRRLGRQSSALLKTATPLSRELRDARAPEQLQAAGALARTLLDADVGETTRALRRADLPRLAAQLSDLTDTLLRQDRLERLLVRSTSVLGEVRARHLVAKSSQAAESVPRMEAVLRESLDVQRQTLAATREAVAIGTQTRDIAAETRTFARDAARAAQSLDRKTGPSLAPTSGG